jgi:hypothetical protein
MPIPNIPEPHHDDLSERDHALQQSDWALEVSNYRELGECIAAFNKFTQDNHFNGMAVMSTENGETHLEIHLFWDHKDIFRCAICNTIPDNPSPFDPGICNNCGRLVCQRCRKKHELNHWRPSDSPDGKVPPF